MTTNTTPTARLAVAVAGLTVLAAACTSGAASDRGAPADTGRGPGAAGSPAAGASDPTEAPTDTWMSPLTEFFTSDVMAADDQQFRADQQRYNELVRDCMAEEGFTWEPFDYDGAVRRDPGPWDLPRDEFVAGYGYGITTIDRDALAVSEDPNQEMLEAMSPPEREAWQQALHGDAAALQGDEPMTAEAAAELTDFGCAGRASDEVYASGTDENALAEFEGLVEDLGALYERIEQDPRTEEANAAWSDCMADAGHPGLDRPQDAPGMISDRVNEALSDGDPADGAPGEGADQPRGPVGVDGRRNGGLDELDPTVVQELRDLELAVAAADHECTTALDLETVRRGVQTEIEGAFLEQHRDELEAYRDALATAGGVG